MKSCRVVSSGVQIFFSGVQFYSRAKRDFRGDLRGFFLAFTFMAHHPPIIVISVLSFLQFTKTDECSMCLFGFASSTREQSTEEGNNQTNRKVKERMEDSSAASTSEHAATTTFPPPQLCEAPSPSASSSSIRRRQEGRGCRSAESRGVIKSPSATSSTAVSRRGQLVVAGRSLGGGEVPGETEAHAEEGRPPRTTTTTTTTAGTSSTDVAVEEVGQGQQSPSLAARSSSAQRRWTRATAAVGAASAFASGGGGIVVAAGNADAGGAAGGNSNRNYNNVVKKEPPHVGGLLFQHLLQDHREQRLNPHSTTAEEPQQQQRREDKNNNEEEEEEEEGADSGGGGASAAAVGHLRFAAGTLLRHVGALKFTTINGPLLLKPSHHQLEPQQHTCSSEEEGMFSSTAYASSSSLLEARYDDVVLATPLCAPRSAAEIADSVNAFLAVPPSSCSSTNMEEKKHAVQCHRSNNDHDQEHQELPHHRHMRFLRYVVEHSVALRHRSVLTASTAASGRGSGSGSGGVLLSPSPSRLASPQVSATNRRLSTTTSSKTQPYTATSTTYAAENSHAAEDKGESGQHGQDGEDEDGDNISKNKNKWVDEVDEGVRSALFILEFLRSPSSSSVGGAVGESTTTTPCATCTSTAAAAAAAMWRDFCCFVGEEEHHEDVGQTRQQPKEGEEERCASVGIGTAPGGGQQVNAKDELLLPSSSRVAFEQVRHELFRAMVCFCLRHLFFRLNNTSTTSSGQEGPGRGGDGGGLASGGGGLRKIPRGVPLHKTILLNLPPRPSSNATKFTTCTAAAGSSSRWGRRLLGGGGRDTAAATTAMLLSSSSSHPPPECSHQLGSSGGSGSRSQPVTLSAATRSSATATMLAATRVHCHPEPLAAAAREDDGDEDDESPSPAMAVDDELVAVSTPLPTLGDPSEQQTSSPPSAHRRYSYHWLKSTRNGLLHDLANSYGYSYATSSTSTVSQQQQGSATAGRALRHTSRGVLMADLKEVQRSLNYHSSSSSFLQGGGRSVGGGAVSRRPGCCQQQPGCPPAPVTSYRCTLSEADVFEHIVRVLSHHESSSSGDGNSAHSHSASQTAVGGVPATTSLPSSVSAPLIKRLLGKASSATTSDSEQNSSRWMCRCCGAASRGRGRGGDGDGRGVAVSRATNGSLLAAFVQLLFNPPINSGGADDDITGRLCANHPAANAAAAAPKPGDVLLEAVLTATTSCAGASEPLLGSDCTADGGSTTADGSGDEASLVAAALSATTTAGCCLPPVLPDTGSEGGEHCRCGVVVDDQNRKGFLLRQACECIIRLLHRRDLQPDEAETARRSSSSSEVEAARRIAMLLPTLYHRYQELDEDGSSSCTGEEDVEALLLEAACAVAPVVVHHQQRSTNRSKKAADTAAEVAAAAELFSMVALRVLHEGTSTTATTSAGTPTTNKAPPTKAALYYACALIARCGVPIIDNDDDHLDDARGPTINGRRCWCFTSTQRHKAEAVLRRLRAQERRLLSRGMRM